MKNLKNVMSIFTFALVMLMSMQAIAQENEKYIKNLASAHNDAMEGVFNDLKSKSLSKDNLEKELNNSLNTFYSKKYINSNELGRATKFSEEAVNSSFKRDLPNISEIIRLNKSYLSQELILYLNQIDKTLIKIDFNKTSLTINELNNIKIEAEKVLKKDEIIVVYSGIEIGKASLEYWSKNSNKWALLFSQKSSSQNKEGDMAYGTNGPAIVGADVAGGVAAAVTTAIVNAAPGVGQVAWGSAIVGGAAGASAGVLINQLWDYFF